MAKRIVGLAVVVLAVAGAPEIGWAQGYAKHSVYVEGLGNGLVYSVNYERRFTESLAGRAGFMILGGQSEEETDDQIGAGVFPVMANYLVGAGSHHLELGGGLVFLAVGGDFEEYGTASAAGVAGITTTFGYRYHPVDGGLLLRIGLTPFYSDGRPQMWGGVSLGYSF
jgi:hypothetical protein